MSFELRGTKNNPFHFSVGAVVFRENAIALIHKNKEQYTLPTETVYLHETLENALKRGLQEELGVTVVIDSFIGSILSTFNHEGTVIEKTAVYFIARYISDGKKSLADDELEDDVIWVSLGEAYDLLQKNNKRGELSIIKRLLEK